MFRRSQLSLAQHVCRQLPRSLSGTMASGGTMAMSKRNEESEDLSRSFLTLEKIDVNIFRMKWKQSHGN